MSAGKHQRNPRGKWQRNPDTGKMRRNSATNTRCCCQGTPSGPCFWCQENTAPAEYELVFAGVTPITYNFPGNTPWQSLKPVGTINGTHRLPRGDSITPNVLDCAWGVVLPLQVQVWSGLNGTGTLLCTSALGAIAYVSIIGGPNPPQNVSFIAGAARVEQNWQQDPCLGQFALGGNPTWFTSSWFVSTNSQPGICDTTRTQPNTEQAQVIIGAGGNVTIRRPPPGPASPFGGPSGGDAMIDAMGYTLDSARAEAQRGSCCDAPKP
jgi:hypothetical protein